MPNKIPILRHWQHQNSAVTFRIVPRKSRQFFLPKWNYMGTNSVRIKSVFSSLLYLVLHIISTSHFFTNIFSGYSFLFVWMKDEYHPSWILNDPLGICKHYDNFYFTSFFSLFPFLFHTPSGSKLFPWPYWDLEHVHGNLRLYFLVL